MKTDLIKFVRRHQKELLAEWKNRGEAALQSQLTASSLNPGRSLVNRPWNNHPNVALAGEFCDFFVEHLQFQLITVLKGGELIREPTLRDELEGFKASGLRMSLSLLVEVVLVGEAVFRDFFLKSGGEGMGISPGEAVEYFEIFHKGFDRLVEHYVSDYCGECACMLEGARTEVADMVYQPGRTIS